MKCFKYSIQQFNNLTTFCRIIIWWWLVFAFLPGWAADSKSVPPQNNPASSTCKIDDKVVDEWKKKVQQFGRTRGGSIDISSPLFFSVFSSQNVKILATKQKTAAEKQPNQTPEKPETRKIHLAWEGGLKRYQVNIYPRGRPWILQLSNLQDTKVSFEEFEEKQFKIGEDYFVLVIDKDGKENKSKFTVVDREPQPFIKQFEEIQKETPDETQRRWRLVVLLLSYGEEWKLEAYQQIADQPWEKETDEFHLAWLGIKYRIPPTCPSNTK